MPSVCLDDITKAQWNFRLPTSEAKVEILGEVEEIPISASHPQRRGWYNVANTNDAYLEIYETATMQMFKRSLRLMHPMMLCQRW
jgi:hypothetical protein